MSASYEAEWRARFDEDAGPASDLPDLPWLRQVLMRRTHRRYAERPVPEALLRLLLGTAFSASSKSDFQQATRHLGQRPRRAAIASRRSCPTCRGSETRRYFWSFAATPTASSGSASCAATCNENGKLEGFFNAAIDAALVLQTFILAAETAGLGCCPISVIRNHADAVAEILGLPDKVFPVAGLCVGYPAAAGHVSMRLPLEATVHIDHYDDRRLAEAVDAYDRRRDARYSLPREQQRSPDVFGYASFYGWSEDKARQAAQPEGQSFPTFLRSARFLPGLTALGRTRPGSGPARDYILRG